MQALGYPCLLEGGADVISLSIHSGVNLVRDLPVTLVFFKTDVVRSCTNPNILSIPLKGSFPKTEMMPGKMLMPSASF